jgi:threonine dehydratase
LGLPALKATDSDTVTFADIQQAARLIEGQVLRTPSIAAPKLSAMAGANVFIKYENMQATGSFKDRGALVKLLSLDAKARAAGVIAMSAGNHAQAVAYHAGRLGIPATIVMPEGTPFNKVCNTEAFGAKVLLSGETVVDSRLLAESLAEEQGLTLIHPFDDLNIIAGQGTAGLEIMQDCAGLDSVIVPVGGGGLIAGVAIAAKTLNPKIEIWGVECEAFPSTHAALYGKQAVCGGQTLAEGIAVKAPGQFTLPIMQNLVSGIILVNETQIETAVFTLASMQKTVAEGASAAALAALMGEPQRFSGRKVGLFHTGANIDPRVLASIMIRGLERESKIVSLRLFIHDRPGMLGEVATELGRCGANILEVHHRRMFLDVPAKGATLDLMIETKDKAHALETVERLKARGMDVIRLNDLSGRENLVSTNILP